MKVTAMMLEVVTKDATSAERLYTGRLISIDQDRITLVCQGQHTVLDRNTVHHAINLNGLPMSLWKAA
jgi:hypothetical protein